MMHARRLGRRAPSPWTCGSLFAIAFAAAPAAAAVDYNAVITGADGPLAERFAVGTPVLISYSLDRSVPDDKPDPAEGIYPGAVEMLSFSFPDFEVSAERGGVVQTFDNVVSEPDGLRSDQVFVIGGPIAEPIAINGAPVTKIEVDFLSDFVAPPSEPALLRSDAIPTRALRSKDNFMTSYTGTDITHVDFVEAPNNSSADNNGCAVVPAGSPADSLWYLLTGSLLLAARSAAARRARASARRFVQGATPSAARCIE